MAAELESYDFGDLFSNLAKGIIMKTGFKDPIAPKEKKKVEKSPWNYDAPSYDERTSCFVSAGTDYGIGYRTPVGTEKITKNYAVPLGRVDTLALYPKGSSREIIQDE